MAVNLARSFWLWNADAGIDFYLATDQPQYLPDDVKIYVKILPIQTGEFGAGFSPKLHLDKLAPPGQTLFIDSDCLIYGDIKPVFEKFKGRSVSVIGNYIDSGEWFGDVAAICKKFAITKMPKFNGGIYYLENGEKAKKIYEQARALETQYDEIGFVRLRNRPNDEVIISLAMALNDETPVIDNGTIMSDPLSCPGTFKTDIIKGKTLLVNPPLPGKLHQDWYPFETVSPLIVHFLGHHVQSYQYKKDAYRLSKLQRSAISFTEKIKSNLLIEWPMRTKTAFKRVLRPLYKLFFGTRRIEPSERL